MRPLELTFSGLRSYRQPTTIDFSGLDLFAVIGDTGAGKSTIIEALSLALYATKTWSGGRLDELIADGVNTLSVRLRFAADGQEWIVTRSRHRNASAPVNKLECPATGEKVDGKGPVNERIEQLLGLTHDQFIRAVVMPQGRFDELLRSTRRERNRILRSIFGLDDLRVARESAEALRERFRPALAVAEARRGDLPPDPDAVVRRARRHLTEAEAAAARLAGAAERADLADRARDTLDTHLASLGRARAAVAADGEVGDPVGELDAIREDADRIAALMAHAADAARRAEAAIDQASRRRAEVLDGFGRRDEATRAEAGLRSCADRLDAATAELAAAEGASADLAANPPPASPPAHLADAARDAEKAVAETKRALEEAAGAAAEGRARWRALVDAAEALRAGRDTRDAAERELGSARRAREKAAAVLEEVDQRLGEAKIRHSDAVRANAAAVAAEECRPGDPCPVCRRPLPAGHESPDRADVAAAEAAVERAEADAAAGRDERAAAEATVTLLEQRVAGAAATVKEADAAADRARRQAGAAGVDVDAVDEGHAVAALDDRARTLSGALAAAEAEERRRRDALVAATTALEEGGRRHAADLRAAREAEQRAARRLAELRRSVADLPAGWRPAPEATAAELLAAADRVDSLLDELDRLDREEHGQREARAAAAQRYDTLRAEAAEKVTAPTEALLGRVRSHCRRIADVSDAVEAAANAAGVESSSLPCVPTVTVSAKRNDLPQLAVDLAVALSATAEILARADATASDLGTRRNRAAADLAGVLAESGHRAVTELHRAAGAARAAVDAAGEAADAAAQAVESAAALDKVLAVARPFVANLDALVATLRDQHFVAHLVSAREAELLAEATRRLKAVTAGRYGFVPDFGVVNIASGEIRTPDTLSGGERFQAALALALALVEIASRGAGRLDAVFVDEGFGSLDAAALDVALDTLGTVAGGGKMVALISHLRPVAEYVDTVLHVTKDDVVGSKIAVLGASARDELLAEDIRSRLTT